MLALLDFARAVRDGLSKPGQRELPSIYLYDEIGTALFEAITFLPEYGLTRADERLLRRHAPAILEHLPPPVVVAELGSGSGRKTRWLLETLARREPVNYYPIDISPAALAKCEQELAVLGAVSIVGLEKSYLDGLQHVAEQRRPGQTLPSSSCARSAAACCPATRCCWAPTWKSRWPRCCLPTTIRPVSPRRST